MNIGQAVRKRIIELCDKYGYTVNSLANQCGVTQSTVNNIVSGRNKSATISTIKKLCDGLDMTIQEFFDDEVFYDLEQEIK
ncbi:MAG: helix-turn-helix transcriptional regulator [Clostridia bacterium]|nr:helix-turn-helix transcriptional regulator [Clostridia bacterium]MBQ2433135.1 helix-turn-helix transcriptional regulator [Clostridia bacterium]MBQ5770147.1 helix-turn-helix transcriptional regulator [Clostridia bacterium]